MASAIIGSKGFIGSAIKQYVDKYSSEEWIGITRDNYDMWKGTRFNNLIWSAGTASKIECKKDERWCYEQNTLGVRRASGDFVSEKFTYISSESVYPDDVFFPDEQCEILELRKYYSDPYGHSKLRGEVEAWHNNDNWLVIRPNGFTGPGLKKNVVYDIMQPFPMIYVDPTSRFQFMHVDQFAEILIFLVANHSNEIFNVTSPDPISPAEIGNIHNRRFGVKIGSPVVKAVLDVSKMLRALSGSGCSMPTSKDAVVHWSDRYDLSMCELRSDVGRP
jgi:nucleoside-diphosphate-sugar epimerase